MVQSLAIGASPHPTEKLRSFVVGLQFLAHASVGADRFGHTNERGDVDPSVAVDSVAWGR